MHAGWAAVLLGGRVIRCLLMWRPLPRFQRADAPPARGAGAQGMLWIAPFDLLSFAIGADKIRVITNGVRTGVRVAGAVRGFPDEKIELFAPSTKFREITMTTATVTSKGRMTIPAEVRKALQVNAGDRVEFVQTDAGQYVLVAVNRSVTELKGMFGKAPSTVALEDMNRVIAARGSALPTLNRPRRSRSA